MRVLPRFEPPAGGVSARRSRAPSTDRWRPLAADTSSSTPRRCERRSSASRPSAPGRSLRGQVDELAAPDFAPCSCPAEPRPLGRPPPAPGPNRAPGGFRCSLRARPRRRRHARRRPLGGRVDRGAARHGGSHRAHVPPGRALGRPTQALLLAAPPDPQGTWNFAALEAILLETIELAKLRLVDLDALRHRRRGARKLARDQHRRRPRLDRLPVAAER